MLNIGQKNFLKNHPDANAVLYFSHGKQRKFEYVFYCIGKV